MSKKRKLFCSICGEVIGVLNAGLVSSVQGYIAHPECRKRRKEARSKRIFPDRYELIDSICNEFKDVRTGKLLKGMEIVELLNEGNELKLVYSCDINASKKGGRSND